MFGVVFIVFGLWLVFVFLGLLVLVFLCFGLVMVVGFSMVLVDVAHAVVVVIHVGVAGELWPLPQSSAVPFLFVAEFSVFCFLFLCGIFRLRGTTRRFVGQVLFGGCIVFLCLLQCGK